MEEETRSQLDVLMGKYAEQLTQTQKQEERKKSEEEEFLSEFQRLRAEIIIPVMEEIGSYLKSHGHDYRVSEREESVDHEGRTRDARVSLDIFLSGIPRSEYRPDNTPSVSFIATKYKKKIMSHSSNMMPHRGGSAGSRGEFSTEEFTHDVVEREILGALEKIFDRK